MKNILKISNFIVGSINNLDEISHNIFRLLRHADKENAELIILKNHLLDDFFA